MGRWHGGSSSTKSWTCHQHRRWKNIRSSHMVHETEGSKSHRAPKVRYRRTWEALGSPSLVVGIWIPVAWTSRSYKPADGDKLAVGNKLADGDKLADSEKLADGLSRSTVPSWRVRLPTLPLVLRRGSAMVMNKSQIITLSRSADRKQNGAKMYINWDLPQNPRLFTTAMTPGGLRFEDLWFQPKIDSRPNTEVKHNGNHRILKRVHKNLAQPKC